MNGLVLRGVRKEFHGNPVLAGVDLDVPARSLTAVLGPSGSGKTTLLRIIAGLEHADAGSIRIDGRDVESGEVRLPPEARRLGYVPQEGALFPHLTVAANIGYGVPRADRRRRVHDLLEMIGLASFGRRYPHQLSGGEQQRVALARALAVQPSIVLLDEPFSALDAGLRVSVRHDVARVLAEAQATAVLVTHDQDEALSMGAQVAVLRAGRVVQHDEAATVYTRPADPDVARFVGDANLLAGVSGGSDVATGLGRHRLAGGTFPVGRELLVLVRPEDIDLVRIQDRPDGPGPWLPGTVTGVDYHGHDSIVSVVTDTPVSDAPLRVRRVAASALHPGDRVAVHSRAGAISAWTR